MTELTQSNYNYQNSTYKSGFIFDFWSCGSAQKDECKIKFPGAYPAGFLKRWKAAFAATFLPSNNTILHVCAGRVPFTEGMTQDIKSDYSPDYLCNAEEIHIKFPELSNKFQWTISDPPYNPVKAKKYYDLPLLDKHKMLHSMTTVTKVGGYIGILDQNTIIGKPANLKKIAHIAVTSIPNTNARLFTVYKKVQDNE